MDKTGEMEKKIIGAEGIEEETAPLVLAGKYELQKVIGEGGSGIVYLAWDRNTERLVAIKVAKIQEEQLKTEMEMLKKLKHPLLPELYDYFYEENGYLVMEYIEGDSLHNVIEREGWIEEKRALIWTEQILSLFAYLHEQKPAVIYRDLKPENIIVCPDGKVRLIDFGAAISMNYVGKQFESLAGTVGYAAPEQFDLKKLEPNSDIYTLGALLYHMLTGYHPAKPPYGIRPVRSMNPELSKGIEWIVEKCTEAEPAKRYQTVEELQIDLHRIDKISRALRLRKRNYLRSRITGRGKRAAEEKRPSYALKKMEKRVWLTEKKSVGLLGVSLGTIALCVLAAGFPLLAKEKESILPVIVYNKDGQKVVIRYDSIYETQGNLVFELEQELFSKEGTQELSLCLTDCTTGERKERVFYLQGKNSQ